MKITLKEALEQGFTHWAFKSDEPFMRKLSKIKPEDFKGSNPIFLITKKGYNFTVSADEICQLVVDMLVDQDEVADEDCELADLALEANYQPLADDINKRLSSKFYYDLTDLQLIP